MASFNVEDFGTERVARLAEAEIAERLSRVQAPDRTSSETPIVR